MIDFLKPFRKKPPEKRSVSWLCSTDAYDTLCAGGYTKLSHNPEILAAVNKIADLISSMTIYEMENTENGDKRIKDGLSRLIDIRPNEWMTRKTFISNIVRALLLEGDGNAVVIPETRDGYFTNLNFVSPMNVSILSNIQGYGYSIIINGRTYNPQDVLHFVINPAPEYPYKGVGYRVALKDVADNLKQAAKTQKGFMEAKWKPSIIVKVDSTVDELATEAGRQKILDSYIKNTNAGEPWLIPSEQFDVEVVRPLSLTDLAISDAVTLDKKTVASLLGAPAFIVGAGDYSAAEWDNFINSRIKPLCNAIEQELTRKLLLSPQRYFKFSVRSLYSYDIKTLADVGSSLYTKGIMTGNEVRDWVALSPLEGLDDLIMLENYIPADMIGQQEKLIQEGDNNAKTDTQ